MPQRIKEQIAKEEMSKPLNLKHLKKNNYTKIILVLQKLIFNLMKINVLSYRGKKYSS